MFLGIVAGLACALFQSVSYVCSAGFMLRYKSSLRLVIFSTAPASFMVGMERLTRQAFVGSAG